MACSKLSDEKSRHDFVSAFCIQVASSPVSRVLFIMVINLGTPLPMCSSHLLRTAGSAYCSPTVLLRIEFTARTCLHAVGELLPRLSILTAKANFHGGIFLLHLSEGRPWRVLPVILTLWSPDFPHAQAFALCPRPSSVLATSILHNLGRRVN